MHDIGSFAFLQRADQPETMKRWFGRLGPATDENIRSWSTKLSA
jgi:hypothetical protein